MAMSASAAGSGAMPAEWRGAVRQLRFSTPPEASEASAMLRPKEQLSRMTKPNETRFLKFMMTPEQKGDERWRTTFHSTSAAGMQKQDGVLTGKAGEKSI